MTVRFRATIEWEAQHPFPLLIKVQDLGADVWLDTSDDAPEPVAVREIMDLTREMLGDVGMGIVGHGHDDPPQPGHGTVHIPWEDEQMGRGKQD